jgi:carotenoid cleavage dioxygenase-like enzyme
MNAFEEGDMIHIDTARFPGIPSPGGLPATLHRWTIDLRAGRATESAIDTISIEFPRIDERLTGQAYRYGYAVHYKNYEENKPARDTALIKYDLKSGACVSYDPGPGYISDECVFVPVSEQAAEDEGWVLSFVYDSHQKTSELVIIDATDFAKGPVAKVRLPRRVPFGFHGSWFSDL